MNIRNFAIIAHVDHGKSTLADRLMEITGTVDKNKHEEQLLDRNPISRERGITIKLAPVRMEYKLITKNEKLETNLLRNQKDISSQLFVLNLIDTPGHVDFSYEVDRTLACVEGAVLLVDATQGIQAQTIANTYKALEKDLVIIPVLNKIDLPNAEVEKNEQQMMEFLGVSQEEIIKISAKTGENVDKVLEAIITKVPPPKYDTIQSDSSANGQNITPGDSRSQADHLQALIFDSYYDQHKGVIAFVRIFEGMAKARENMKLSVGNISFETTEVGIFTPDLVSTSLLSAGDIGYIVTNLKDIHSVRVGDTIVKGNQKPVAGYKQVKPMVYASVFPTDPADYENLKKALEKIYLNDSALQFNAIYSTALGAGFRVGFLGLLHADVVRERLEREYDLSLVLTPPQVDYEMKDGVYYEPIVKILIITPQEYVGSVMRLCEDHRATFLTMDNKNQVTLEYELPLSEMISDFFDELKSVTSGYASFDWELLRFEKADADKLAILLNGDEIEEFSQIVVQERSLEKGRELTSQLKDLIPKQQYEVKIQAKYKGKIIASERLSALRKDVTQKLYGGDRTRKDKLLKKQKEGKKKMKMIGKVEVPKEAFMKLFKRSS